MCPASAKRLTGHKERASYSAIYPIVDCRFRGFTGLSAVASAEAKPAGQRPRLRGTMSTIFNKKTVRKKE
jgi:hypothetical protein